MTKNNKLDLQDILEEKSPTIIMDALDDKITRQDIAKKVPKYMIKYNYVDKDGSKVIPCSKLPTIKDNIIVLKEKKIIEELDLRDRLDTITYGFKRDFVYYHDSDYSLNLYSKDARTPLIKNTTDIFYLIPVSGYIRVYLVNPQYSKNLYPKKNVASIDLWKPDYKKFPLHEKIKIASDTVHSKEIICIPPNWWYAIVVPKDAIVIEGKTENILSNLL